MKIGIDMGHSLSGAGTGASGLLTEVVENRKIGNRLIEILKEKGHTVVNCSVDSASSTSNQLSGIVKKANAQKLDLFVSIHLNAGGGNGTETYVYPSTSTTTKTKAKTINDAIVASCNFRNRGVKESSSLYVLKNTTAPAILVEVCFVDSSEDKGKLNCEAVAKAMFKGITGAEYVANNANNASSNSSSLYRVRKSWNDSASQIGAYSSLENAKACVDKNPSYKAFNESGEQVYPAVTTSNSCEKVTLAPCQEVGGSGIAKITTPSGIIFRDHYCTHCGVKQGTYEYGEEVVYDMKCYTEKYTWISWISASTGKRRWMPIGDRRTGEKWATVR